MKRIFKVFTLITALPLLFLTGSCGEEINAPQDFVAGTVTFNDSNLNFNGRYYAISVFPDVSNPFSQPPLRSDSLAVTISGGLTSAYYKVSGFASGNYYIGSTVINSSNGNVIAILGVYGCDTLVNCSNPTKVTVPNYAGTGNLNFRSKTN